MGKLSGVNKLYQCDACKEIFVGRDAALVPIANNVDIVTPPYRIIYVNKAYELHSSIILPDADDNKLLACPYCGLAHPFGFNLIEEEE